MKNDNPDTVITPGNGSIIHKISYYLIKNSPGMRVIKTALAVIICLLIENLRGADMPTHACIATVVCMQPTLRSTFKASIDRTLGTIIAGAYSYLMAVLLIARIGMNPNCLLFYFVIGILSFPLMALMITIKKPSSLAISVIVFLIIMLNVSETNPLTYAVGRVIATLIGIAVALFVNWLPPLNKIGEKIGSVNIEKAETQNSGN